MTVSDLLRRVTSSELSEWQAFYNIEPFGEWRADFRAGIIAASNVNLHQSRNAPPTTPLDFMPLCKQPNKRKDKIKLFKAQFAHIVKVKE